MNSKHIMHVSPHLDRCCCRHHSKANFIDVGHKLQGELFDIIGLFVEITQEISYAWKCFHGVGIETAGSQYLVTVKNINDR